MIRKILFGLVFSLFLTAWDTPPAPTIDWVPYETAFAQAEQEHKQVVIIFSAPWCRACNSYEHNVLTNPRVIRMSRHFVMVHINVDEQQDINQQYRPDGGYIPRTLVFREDGTHRSELHRNAAPLYFFDVHNPNELLALFQRARH